MEKEDRPPVTEQEQILYNYWRESEDKRYVNRVRGECLKDLLDQHAKGILDYRETAKLIGELYK